MFFLIPGDLQTRTGGYGYDRRIIDGLRQAGWRVDVRQLDGSFPLPNDAALAHAETTLAAIPDDAVVLIDGLALGAMPAQVLRHAARLRIVALVHHPLAHETGLDPQTAAHLHASETAALTAVRHVVVTSRRTVAALAEFSVAPDRISVVEPGTDRAALAAGSPGNTTELLCVASLTPRKGHRVLFEALARLRAHDWRLTCVGSIEREPASVAGLKDALRDLGIEARVVLAGEADGAQIGTFYDRSDVFVLPTFYEGFGMVIAEALARGLPVISTPTGGIAELVTPACGILVPAGDVAGWTDALGRMFDAATRREFRRGAAARRATLPTWEDACRQMAAALARQGSLHG